MEPPTKKQRVERESDPWPFLVSRVLVTLILQYAFDWTQCDRWTCDRPLLDWLLQYVPERDWRPSVPRLLRLGCRLGSDLSKWISCIAWDEKSGLHEWRPSSVAWAKWISPRENVKSCLSAAASAGQWEAFSTMVETWNIDWCDFMILGSMAPAAYRGGHIDFARRLRDESKKHGGTTEWPRGSEADTFGWMCQEGQYRGVEYVVQELKVSDSWVLDKGLKKACKGNQLQIVQFLAARLPVHDIDYNDLAEIACKKGHVEIVDWLLTQTRPKWNWIMNSFRVGSFPVVQRLCQYHALPSYKDGSDQLADLVCESHRNSDVRVAKWLIDCRPNIHTLLRELHLMLAGAAACANHGDQELLQWLLDAGWTPTRPELDNCIKHLVEHGHLATAEWWMAKWNVSAPSLDADTIKELAIRKNTLPLEWILDHRTDCVVDGALVRACQWSNWPAAELLIRYTKGVFPKDTIRSAWRAVLNQGDTQRVAWFHGHFALSRDTALRAFFYPCINNNLAMVRYLASWFSFSSDEILKRLLVEKENQDYFMVSEWHMYECFETLHWIMHPL